MVNVTAQILIYALSILGFLTQAMTAIGLCFAALLAFLIYSFYHIDLTRNVKLLLFIAIIFLVGAFFSHHIPGYHNWKIYSQLRVSDTSAAFDMWFNLDKTIVGLLFLAIAPLNIFQFSRHNLVTIVAYGTMLTFLLMIVSFALQTIAFDPKLPAIEVTILWLVKMLCFTVLIEEVFFRGFVQHTMINATHNKIMALVLASMIFALFHISGGMFFVFAAFIAGLFYGAIYIKTGHLSAAILLHFLLNSIHFFFFSYPHYQGVS